VKFIDKLRSKPERERKIILYTILVIIGLILGSIWIYASYKNIREFKMPKIEIPQ